MLKTHESIINNLHRFLDFLLAVSSWLIVYYVRFEVLEGGQPGLLPSFLKSALLIGVTTVYFFSREGLYKSQRLSSRQEEIQKVVKANVLVVVFFVLLLYFAGFERLSRLVILTYLGFSSILFVVTKVTIRNILRQARSRGYNLRHVFLIGNSPAIERYVQNIKSFKESGIAFHGWADSKNAAEKYDIKSFDLADVFSKNLARPDSIVIGYHGAESYKIDQILREIHNDVIPIVVLPDLTYSFVGYHVDQVAGMPALVVNQPNFSTVDVISKRIFDAVAAAFGLLLISPFLSLIAIGVKLTSPGPIFFGQERIGLDGHRFKMWKFRTMKVGTEKSSANIPGWTVKDDPRKTKFGSFLRATSLDELPQLWNVFVGDMSLVGPRPEQPYFVEKFKSEIPAYMLRHKMKAGITGWAQVNGWRGDTSLHKRIECDLYYIRNWSLWFDIKILFLTFWKGFINRNAY